MSKKKLKTQQVMSELTGKSVFFPKKKDSTSPNASMPKKAQTNKPTDLQTSRVTEKQTNRLTESGTLELTDLQSYELRKYKNWKRIEVRLTPDQRKFLIDFNEEIAQTMPEGERNNPQFKRITNNSIIRVCVETIRQLKPKVDSSKFQNENDLLHSLFEELLNKLTDLQSSRVPE